MAVLGYGTQVIKEFSSGLADVTALYVYKDANAGDTINLGVDFQIIKQAIVIDVIAEGNGVATIAGTVLTLPAGVVVGTGWLLVWGE